MNGWPGTVSGDEVITEDKAVDEKRADPPGDGPDDVLRRVERLEARQADLRSRVEALERQG